MVPKQYSQAYPRMLHLKKKRRIRDGHLTNVTDKQPGKDRQCTPDRNGFKICEKLTHFAGAKDITWDNVTLLEERTSGTPHQAGTLLENSGTPWGVRYIRLTSTGLPHIQYLSLKITNCSGERSFSKPKRLKPCTRSTTSQKRLQSLVILYVEHALLGKIK